MRRSKGFTLIELLVVIAIIAVLAVVVVLTLNPAELLKQSRDARRVSDLTVLRNAILLDMSTASSSTQNVNLGVEGTCYASAATVSLANCTARIPGTTQIQTSTTPLLNNGQGWVPVDFNSNAVPIVSTLPVDPVNNNVYYYTYAAHTAAQDFIFTNFFESAKYAPIMQNDGGPSSTVYEVATIPGLSYGTSTATSTDTTPPAITISSPASAATVSSTITISGTSSDNMAVATVGISINGGAYQSANGTSSWTYSWNTTGVSNGNNTITARATDTSNNNTTSTISVTVSNGVAVTCHVVSPAGSGSKTGADWNNAMAGLPATLIRGDVYYLADGTYPKYVFTTAVSGTKTIEIRKAQTYDHCTDTGWVAGTMGSSQAVFAYTASEPLFNISTSYVTINGNGTSLAPGCGGGGTGATKASAPSSPADCGIKVDNSPCVTGTLDACDDPIKSANPNTIGLTLRYVETMGNNNNASEQMAIFQPYSGDGGGNFSHLFMHNVGCVYIQDGQGNEIVDHSYFWGNNTNAAGCHGQASFDAGSDSNTTYSNNVFRDINGTAIWTFAATSQTHDNWLFYNNVIWADNQANDQQEDGMIACINAGTICTNFVFDQNTMINLNYQLATVYSNPGGSITFENNIWYLGEGTTGQPGGISFVMAGSPLTEDYNSFLQSGSTSPGTGPHDITDAAAPNPFVNWTNGNFNIGYENADWNTRALLGIPFTSDVNGTGFSTDRGAYQH
jgi:prepilin-type N-terminal cleavage/methylation domain-containing protein